MKWEGNRQSDNVEDRRGSGGGGGGFGFGGKSIGIGTIVLALIGSAVFGVNPLTMLDMLSGGGGQVPVQQQGQVPTGPSADRETAMVRTVLADTEDTWTELFKAHGAAYQKPTLVLFSDATGSACGTGRSASGPFYCPEDQKVYIDLTFYQLMKDRFKVEGEFAQAYVLAHEVGHHVQTLMGTASRVSNAQQNMSQGQANAMSVRMELQADCYAGVWAHHANRSRGILEQGDVEAALNAATAIGDDTIQRSTQGRVVPDAFTHGTSEQRARWFKKGVESGQVEGCDTFKTNQL
ncbi:MAG: KPN_02809 family neutral zinc metallopeptidase [Telluria sp.]